MSDVTTAELVQDAQDFMIYKYTMVATCVFLTYDYLLTFKDEVRLVWKARWSLMKVLFLSTRVFAFATTVVYAYLFFGNNNNETCRALTWTSAELISAVFCVAEVMLFLRVSAIWRENKFVLALLSTLLLVGFTGFLYVAQKDASRVAAVSGVKLFGTGCLLNDSTGVFFICHVILLVDGIVMISLILLKASLMTRYEGGRFLSRGYQLIVIDGIGYFIIVSLLSLTSIFIARLAPHGLRLFHVGLHAALASILSCRLLLRLRIAYNAPETTVGNSSTLSEWIARGTSLHVPAAVPSPSPLDHGHNRIVRTNILAPGRRCSPNTETIELVTFAKPG